jgi:DNA helicase HerA-like ATPase
VRATIDDVDVIFHSLFIGSTGAGKTNALLYWLRRLFIKRKDVALVLVDPHGDAAIDLFRSILRSERDRVILLDPNIWGAAGPLDGIFLSGIMQAFLFLLMSDFFRGGFGRRP